MMDENYFPPPSSFTSVAVQELQVRKLPWFFLEPSSSHTTHIWRLCCDFDVLLEKHQSHWKFPVIEGVSVLFYIDPGKLNRTDKRESNSELRQRLNQHIVEASTPNDVP